MGMRLHCLSKQFSERWERQNIISRYYLVYSEKIAALDCHLGIAWLITGT